MTNNPLLQKYEELYGKKEPPKIIKAENTEVKFELKEEFVEKLKKYNHFEEVYQPPGKYGVYGVFEVSEHQMLTFARALEELAQENPQSGL